MQYCSSQHQTLLSPPDTSTTGHCFYFDSASSFLLEVLLCSSPVAYWAPTDLGSLSFSVIFTCLFILTVHRVLKARMLKWFAIPFSGGPHFVQLSTITGPSWVALHGMAHSFTESDKAVIYVIYWLVFCDCGFHSVCPLMDKDKWLMEASWWERLTVGGESRQQSKEIMIIAIYLCHFFVILITKTEE